MMMMMMMMMTLMMMIMMMMMMMMMLVCDSDCLVGETDSTDCSCRCGPNTQMARSSAFVCSTKSPFAGNGGYLTRGFLSLGLSSFRARLDPAMPEIRHAVRASLPTLVTIIVLESKD
jgi:hypothetical protein